MFVGVPFGVEYVGSAFGVLGGCVDDEGSGIDLNTQQVVNPVD